jgi:hypothetical protein
LQKKRLLKVEIQMPRTTGPIDPSLWAKLRLEWCGADLVDFITAPADPRSNGREDGLRLPMKLLTHELDGCGDDARGDAFSSRVHNAGDRETWSNEDNGEAIRRDDPQREIWAIGDETISWHSPYA